MSEYANNNILKLQGPDSQPPPPPPPVAQDQPPPPQNQPPQYQPPKPASKVPVMAIVIVVIVVIAAIAAALLFMGGAQKSPDNTFDSFVDQMNAEDFKGAYDMTTMVFDEDYDDKIKVMGELQDENETEYSVDIDETRYEDDMTNSEIDDMEEFIDHFEYEYDVEVEDFCIVEYTMTITKTLDGETDTDTKLDDMSCIKVDGKWYIVFDIIGYGDYDNSSSTPAGAWNNIETISKSEIKLTFGTFSSDVQPQDIKIFVKVDGVATGIITIPNNTASSPQTCVWADAPIGAAVTYTDYNPGGGLINSGDYLVLSGLQPGTTYAFEVFHVPTDATIYMTGDSPSVQTPALSTPAGSWANTDATSQTEITLTFGAFSLDVQPQDIKIFVKVDGTASGWITIPSNTASSPQTCVWTNGPTGAVATYIDYNSGGGLINSGDYLELSGLQPGTTYAFEIFHVPTDATISMTGDSSSVQTPASSTLAGSWNNAEAISQTEGKITFGSFTTEVHPMDIKIFVRANGVSIGEITFINNTEATPYDLTWTGGPSGAVASYTDYNYAGGLINSGDYISFTGLSSGTTYTFEVFHIPTDSTVPMVGASGGFTTP